MEDEISNPKTTFKCKKCEFKWHKIIIFKKHSNTKDLDQNNLKIDNIKSNKVTFPWVYHVLSGLMGRSVYRLNDISFCLTLYPMSSSRYHTHNIT